MDKVIIKTSYHFYLHHKPTKTLIEKLTWTQMNAVCRTLAPNDYDKFNVWVEEINQWIQLELLIGEILKRTDGLFRNPPNPTKDPDGKTHDHHLVDAPEDLREHTRYDSVLPVTVDIMGSLVNTFTEDISFGGMRFKNKIPTRKIVSHCFVYHHIGNEFIEFKVTPIYDNPDAMAFHRVKLVSCNDLDRWQAILTKAKNRLKL